MKDLSCSKKHCAAKIDSDTEYNKSAVRKKHP